MSRPAPSLDDLHLAFSRQVCRNQRRSDGTVTVEGIRYEVPSRFRHLPRIMLRYPGWDKSRLLLTDEKTGNPLVQLLPLDKEQNARGLRRSLEPVEPCAPIPAIKPALPALLRQWLADHAATGLPPAYLPKDELKEDTGHV